MLEELLTKLSKYIEIIGVFFESRLESFREKNEEVFHKAENKLPSLPGRVPSSLILSKVYCFLSPQNFTVFRIYLILSIFFLLGTFLSFIPILYPTFHLLALILFFAGIFLVGLGEKLGSRVKTSLENFGPNFDLLSGFFVIGLTGIVINFIRVGIPLFNSSLRVSLHNQLWSLSYLLYTVGMISVYVKNRDKQTFSLLFVLSFFIALFSGFRTDFLILLGPLLVFRYLMGDFERKKVFYLVFFIIVFIIGIRYALLTSSSIQPSPKEVLLSDIFFGKVGLNFYVLSIFLKEGGLFGIGGGMISLGKFFLQQFSIPSLSFGAVGSDLVINLIRRFESSLVGPTYLDLGVPGVLIVTTLLGFIAELPRRIYKLTSTDFFLGLYSINVSIMLVWLQTGVVQYYLFFMFLGIGLYCLDKVEL